MKIYFGRYAWVYACADAKIFWIQKILHKRIPETFPKV